MHEVGSRAAGGLGPEEMATSTKRVDEGLSAVLLTPSGPKDPPSDQSGERFIGKRARIGGKRIWIDLDNSPHVPFFAPIIEALEQRGFPVLVTARDCFQVCSLAQLLRVPCHRVGRHYGKNSASKLLGLGIRAFQLMPAALREKPVLALSHGSRSQLIASWLLGIPSLMIGDYEFSRIFAVIRPQRLIVPDVIPDDAFKSSSVPLLKYPGIKEDVYVTRFRPDPALARELGLDQGKIVVTIRPPATEAHYHVPESDRLFESVLDFLGQHPELKIIMVPRNQQQGEAVRALKPQLFLSGQVLIPDRVVDGMNLIWYSDLVISGGGTMNREAAALGVPVYSIFRGKIGAVDRYLAAQGRLTLIESVEDLPKRMVLQRRHRPANPSIENQGSLETIVSHIITAVEETC
jgi:predicted glycosyltransferase